MLTSEQIIQFQEIYQKHFGEQISQKDAFEQGLMLVNLIKAVMVRTEQDKK